MPALFGPARAQPVAPTFDPFSGYDSELLERLSVVPLGKYADGKVRFAWPEMSGLPGFERAQSDMAAGLEPNPQDTAAAAGGMAMTGSAATMLGHGVPANALGIFGGRKLGSGTTNQLAKVQSEVAQLGERYRQLYGRPYSTPQPRPGTPADQVLAGEMQTLGELQGLVAAREQSLAAVSPAQTVPRVADRTGERDAMFSSFEEMPPAGQAFKGRQGLMSRKDQERAMREFYNRPGEPLGTPDPWGNGPRMEHGRSLSHKDVVQSQVDYETAAKAVVTENQKLAANLRKQNVARHNGDTRELKLLQDENNKLRSEIGKLNSVVTRLSRQLFKPGED